MRLIYFDETKFSESDPFFFIGGILLPEKDITALENTLMQIQYNFFSTNKLDDTTEFHSRYIFHGKGPYRKRSLPERIKLFEDVGKFLTQNKVPIRIVCIDVKAHRKRYQYPEPEYNLGLMLVLERFCIYLEEVDDIGIVFGDYEKDENETIHFGFFSIQTNRKNANGIWTTFRKVEGYNLFYTRSA